MATAQKVGRETVGAVPERRGKDQTRQGMDWDIQNDSLIFQNNWNLFIYLLIFFFFLDRVALWALCVNSS